MLRLNNRPANLDLTILGWIRQGHVLCSLCGAEQHWNVPNKFQPSDPLYGREANGQHCECCGKPLDVEVSLVQPG